MEPTTLLIYSFVTSDDRRRARFLQRWEAGGVDALRKITTGVVLSNAIGDDPLHKLQCQLLALQLHKIDYLRLGYAIAAYGHAKEHANG